MRLRYEDNHGVVSEKIGADPFDGQPDGQPHIYYPLPTLCPGLVRYKGSNIGEAVNHEDSANKPTLMLIKAAAVQIPGDHYLVDEDVLLAQPNLDAMAAGFPGTFTFMDTHIFHPAHPRVPESTQYHFVEGGQSFVLHSFPISGEFDVSPVKDLTSVRAWLGVDEVKLARYPLLQRLKQLSSFISFGDKGTLYDWFKKHQRRGWASHGDLMGPEGLSNFAYSGIAALIYGALTKSPGTDDAKGAWRFAYEAIINQIHHGMILSPGDKFHGTFRNEKSNNVRTGTFLPPKLSHQWNEALAMASVCWPEDPDIQYAMKANLEYCMTRVNRPWQRGYGIRQLGRYLACLAVHHHFHYSKRGYSIEQLIQKAENEINYALGLLKPGERHFPNEGYGFTSVRWDGSQDAECLFWMRHWHKLGAIVDNNRINELIGYCIVDGTVIENSPIGPILNGAYWVDGAARESFGMPEANAAWLPLLYEMRAEYPAEYQACVNIVTGTIWQAWSNYDGNPALATQEWGASFLNPYGSAETKIHLHTLMYAKDEYLI